ncbi:MAG TPA: IPT/TIG domain-containing protein, partial [Terriglobia bacterium]|nr:IPT/TIG domain-containing protein [Terriglobia bacterium]
MKITGHFALITLLACSMHALAAAPHIFYSDLDGGPSAGGQANGGAFVTIYGRGFGNSRGSSTITIGGKPAAAYPIWADSKVCFQLGAASQSGNIIVSVDGQTSNGVPFIVRSGKIHFVAASGADHNPGTFESPWRTVVKAVKSVEPG